MFLIIPYFICHSSIKLGASRHTLVHRAGGGRGGAGGGAPNGNSECEPGDCHSGCFDQGPCHSGRAWDYVHKTLNDPEMKAQCSYERSRVGSPEAPTSGHCLPTKSGHPHMVRKT